MNVVLLSDSSTSLQDESTTTSPEYNIPYPTDLWQHEQILVSDKLTFTESNFPTINVKICGITCEAILDSGARVSAISSKLLSDLNHKGIVIPIHKTEMELTSVDRKPIPVQGEAHVEIEVHNRTIMHRFMVLLDLHPAVLLGYDFLRNQGIVLSPLDQVAWFSRPPVTKSGSAKEDQEKLSKILHQTANPSLTETQNKQLRHILEQNLDLFADTPGRTQMAYHEIDTGEARPICQQPRRFSRVKQQQIDEEIDRLLNLNLIEPTCSPWASPIVPVQKSDGKIRLCVDYKKINAVTKKEVYPIPPMDDLLDLLQGVHYLSTLDLCSGYWQVAMHPGSEEKTAFICHRGLFKFKVMPFGLCNAPFTFQRLMDTVLADLKWRICLVYLDDIIVISPDWESHLQHLQTIFSRLKSAGLTLNKTKCRLAFQELPFLGHVVGVQGLRADPSKISAVTQFPRPHNLKSLRRFLGLAGWYRRFIPNFSQIANPLYTLTRKGVKFKWTDDQENSFNQLRQCLTSAPVMARPDFTRPFILQTDASDTGLGVVLTQVVDKNEKVIAYGSRTLSTLEQKYSATEKECLAVLFGVEKFRPYLEGQEFTVVSDHHALQWLMSCKDSNGRLGRWVLRLQPFTFTVQHRTGKLNIVPDALSRAPVNDMHQDVDSVSPVLQIDSPSNGNPNHWDSTILPVPKEIFLEELRKDQYCAKILEGISIRPDNFPKFKVENDYLLRYDGNKRLMKHHPELSPWRLIIPKVFQKQLIIQHHDSPMAGHLGIEKTWHRISPYYYWPNLHKNIKGYVRTCLMCQKHKPTNYKPSGFMVPNVSNSPWHTIAIDLMGPLPCTKKGNKYILVLVDTCTKWIEIFPLRKANAKSIELKLREVFYRFGFPQVLITDNSTPFTGQVFAQFCERHGIRQHYTSPYHPQANPTERSNRDIRPMLATFVNSDHSSWDQYLAEFAFALRTAVHSTTGFAPAYLNLGRQIRIPHDLLQLSNETQKLPDSECSNRLQYAFEVAKSNTDLAKGKQKYYYDKGRTASTLQPGDLVWLRNHPVSSTTKGVCKKLSPLFIGPFRLRQKVGDVDFRLEDPETLEDRGIAHVSNLKKAYVSESV